jgi:two-component system chemotaxis sensor kinase CheA
LEGEETTVDRTIIDHLTEPFVHMVRNSVDHGIESTETRLAHGKSAEAVIKIKSYTKENKFYSEISDDGGGIEWDKLMEHAAEKGMYTKEEMSTWDLPMMKKMLLFQGGLSASEEITDISGRGVGLDAVYKAIVRLGGSVLVDTVPGQGTTFTLRMPMTLAIMQALLVKVNERIYALPGNEVVRSLTITKDMIKSVANTNAVVVDGLNVVLYDLGEIFEGKQLLNSEKEHITLVLLRREQSVVGCLVDKLVAEEEILVKQLGNLLKQNSYFSGATILADGNCAPIINVEGLTWKT